MCFDHYMAAAFAAAAAAEQQMSTYELKTADYIAIVAAFLAAVQAVLMWLIAHSVNRFTVSQNRIEIQRGINSQWQDFNMNAVQSGDFRTTLSEIGYEGKSTSEKSANYLPIPQY